MQSMGDKEGCEMLFKAGFTAREIEKLRKLRKDYIEQEMYHIPVAHHPKSGGWFEKIIRKIPGMCRHLADSGAVFWMNNPFSY